MSNETVYLEKTDTGATLATWWYCAMWQLYTAEKCGLTGYINWPKGRSLIPHQDETTFANYPNMFDWYCWQPHFKNLPAPPRTKTWIWEQCPELGQYCFAAQSLAFIREWYQKHLIFKPNVIADTHAIIHKYGINCNNTLAITWRGCDSTDDGRPRMPIETYYPFIDQILAEEPNLAIFATAEETTVVDTLKKRYPQTFTIPEFFSAPFGYKGHSEYLNPTTGYERGLQTCVLVNLLSKCKHHIKNRSSMSAVASWLNKDGNIICLAHGEDLGYSFDITKAEHKGKIIPLVV